MGDQTAGSTFAFNGAVAKLVDIGYTVGGDEVDVTNLSSAQKEFEAGIDEVETVITVNGVSTIARKDTGTGLITWQSGETDEITNAICLNVERAGAIGDPITTALTFKPTPA